MLALMRRAGSFLLVFSLLLASSAGCKKTSTPSGPRTCAADSDCEISCDHAGDCCHFPYCESAQHRDDAKDAREANQKRCTPADQNQCPQIGSRMQVDYRVVPRCKASACVAEKVPK
jgi:hypothetical protein